MPNFFSVRENVLSDGSTLYEVVTPGGERVASATRYDFAAWSAQALNESLQLYAETYLDFVVNA